MAWQEPHAIMLLVRAGTLACPRSCDVPLHRGLKPLGRGLDSLCRGHLADARLGLHIVMWDLLSLSLVVQGRIYPLSCVNILQYRIWRSPKLSAGPQPLTPRRPATAHMLPLTCPLSPYSRMPGKQHIMVNVSYPPTVPCRRPYV